MEKHCEFCGNPIEDFTRNTRKYCNDNCKQLAFYARQGKNWGKQSEGINFPQENLPFSVKPNFTLNGKEENETEIAQTNVSPQGIQQEKELTTDLSVKSDGEKQKYQWVNSRLIDAIDRNRNQSDAEAKFCYPEHYWSRETIDSIYWVSVRFRCLLENILRLSNYKFIDRNTLIEISRAFNDLTASYHFKGTMVSYPFSSQLIELRDKFNATAKESLGDEITLRLSVNRKAELMAARFLLINFVPKKNFSQLRFSGGIREEVEKEFNKSA